MKSGEKVWFYNKIKNIFEGVRVVRETGTYGVVVCKRVVGPHKKLELYISRTQLYPDKRDALESVRVRLQREVKRSATKAKIDVAFLKAFEIKYGGRQ